MSHASSLVRAVGVGLLALSGVALTACEDETPVKKGPSTAVDPAEQARIDQGKKLLKAEADAFNEKQYDRARKLLRQAAELNNESQRFEIEEAQDKLDKKQAKLWANDVEDTFNNKDCPGAFKQLAEPLKQLAESEVFVRELRHLVGAQALKCAQDMVDQKVLAMAFADSRKVLTDPKVADVLGPNAVKKLGAELETTILETLRAQIEPDLKARKWEKAVDKIEAAVKAGSATDEQADNLLAGVRQGVTPEIAALAEKNVGQRDAPAALKQIDGLLKLVRWAVLEPGSTTVQTGAAMPEDLAKKRYALAVWVEAQRLAMRPTKKPETRYTFGSVAVAPAAHADAAAKQDIPHGTRIWIIGAGKDRALVTTEDPGDAPLARLLDKAAGWVETSHLAKEATLNWLVPDDQLKGQRVWGPLRGAENLWELGVVVDVSGKDITVQRLADGVNQKLTRQKLRSGRLSPGTRVLTFCIAKEQPAQVVEIPPTARTAKLKCDGGQEKEEDLASLRSKPEILPATK